MKYHILIIQLLSGEEYRNEKSCLIGGNPNEKCSGICPPCQSQNGDGLPSCYQYEPYTRRCPPFPGMVDMVSNNIITGEVVREKRFECKVVGSNEKCKLTHENGKI